MGPMNTTPPSPDRLAARRTGAVWYGAIGLGLVIGGVSSYLLLLDHYWIRTWAIPNSVMVVVGTAVAWYATTRRPFWVGLTSAILCTLLTGLFLVGMYGLVPPRAPGPGNQPIRLASFAESLPDEHGNSVRLSDYAGKGPVLLVFYRGHW